MNRVWIRPLNVWISAPNCGQVGRKCVPKPIMCGEWGHPLMSSRLRSTPGPRSVHGGSLVSMRADTHASAAVRDNSISKAA
jgi:hypothetical protein